MPIDNHNMRLSSLSATKCTRRRKEAKPNNKQKGKTLQINQSN